jgi:mRNA-degrading endonuclease RelE of RelBE toxin-antitoxin system
MFTIEFADSVGHDLSGLRAFERALILDRIDEQLMHQPATPTRNRKIVPGLIPPWEHEQPVWELRIGEYRVFYDVNEAESRVTVRAIRHKPPHKTIEETCENRCH